MARQSDKPTTTSAQGSRRTCGRFVVMGVLIAALAPPVLADYWYEHYARAERALEAEEWAAAVEEINEALARKGDSGARVRSYGMKVIAYFPYLKLGTAYFHLGQLEAALQAFETEAQLGAVQASVEDLEELERLRGMTREAQAEASASEQRQIEQIVRASLEKAATDESRGRLEEAMAALGRGLAVAPDHPQLLARMDRMRAAVVQQEQRRRDAERADELTREGSRRLEEGAYAEAAGLLRQSLDLRPDEETRSLLERAQEALRSELAEAAEDTGPASAVAETMTAALDLEQRGQLDDALARLQTVLAVEPGNSDALEMQQRLFRAQRARDRSSQLALELAEAESAFAAMQFETALAAANRALALDRGNREAMEQIGRAYREISRQLLGSETKLNIRPAIRFTDLREEREDGTRAQLVRSPHFRLSGVAIDESPVEVVFLDPADRELAATGSNQPVGEYHLTEFALEQKLQAGVSTFRLVATDGEGLTSSGEYTVVYQPPFYRTAWFLLLAVSLPLAIVGGVIVRSNRRRRRLLRRRFNPYIAGAPVLDDEMFFGREVLIERILQTVHNNSLLLHGERRIGKTSLQHRLKRRLQGLNEPDYQFFPVFIDLEGTPESRFFALLAEEIFEELDPVLGGLEPSAALAAGGEYGYRDLVADLRRVLKHLNAQNEKQVKVVLLIDEVDELNDYSPRISQRLRSLFMKSFAENLVAVVSGVGIKKEWEQETSPWYNFFEEVRVEAFRPEDAIALVTRPIEGVFRFERGAADRIVALTQGKPYLIQKQCVALVVRLHEQGRTTITLADVEATGQPSDR